MHVRLVPSELKQSCRKPHRPKEILIRPHHNIVHESRYVFSRSNRHIYGEGSNAACHGVAAHPTGEASSSTSISASLPRHAASSPRKQQTQQSRLQNPSISVHAPETKKAVSDSSRQQPDAMMGAMKDGDSSSALVSKEVPVMSIVAPNGESDRSEYNLFTSHALHGSGDLHRHFQFAASNAAFSDTILPQRGDDGVAKKIHTKTNPVVPSSSANSGSAAAVLHTFSIVMQQNLSPSVLGLVTASPRTDKLNQRFALPATSMPHIRVLKSKQLSHGIFNSGLATQQLLVQQQSPTMDSFHHEASDSVTVSGGVDDSLTAVSTSQNRSPLHSSEPSFHRGLQQKAEHKTALGYTQMLVGELAEHHEAAVVSDLNPRSTAGSNLLQSFAIPNLVQAISKSNNPTGKNAMREHNNSSSDNAAAVESPPPHHKGSDTRRNVGNYRAIFSLFDSGVLSPAAAAVARSRQSMLQPRINALGNNDNKLSPQQEKSGSPLLDRSAVHLYLPSPTQQQSIHLHYNTSSVYWDPAEVDDVVSSSGQGASQIKLTPRGLEVLPTVDGEISGIDGCSVTTTRPESGMESLLSELSTETHRGKREHLDNGCNEQGLLAMEKVLAVAVAAAVHGTVTDSNQQAMILNDESSNFLADFENSVNPPMTGQQVLSVATLSNQLTVPECREILSYPLVYFVGNRFVKDQNAHRNLPCNYGFDTEQGNYNVQVGDHIAFRYEVLGALGSGSFGDVYRCRDHKIAVDVAIKIIKNQQRFSDQALVELNILNALNADLSQALFSGENSSAADLDTASNDLQKGDSLELSSDGAVSVSVTGERWKQFTSSVNIPIIQLHQYFQFRSHMCFVFPLFGLNLYEYMKQQNFRGLSISFVKKVAFQLLQCLRFLKQRGICHCDLKPENILLKNERTASVVLIDFGSSCYENQTKYTYIQSRFYRAPEVLLNIPYGKVKWCRRPVIECRH
jgi:hypothetical protein